jgi:intracellular multiplication protein IcmV
MGLLTTIQKRLHARFNVLQWMNYSQWRQFNHALIDSFKRTFAEQSSVENTASFEEMVRHFKLTEHDIIEKQQRFLRLTKWCLGVWGMVMLYFAYLILSKAWWAILPALVLAMIILCQAFRYHFWYFQIKQRRLGCRLEDWFQATFRNN